MDRWKTWANKRQQEVLIERLHNNLEMARGNQADANIVQYWIDVSNKLNSLGCNRTAQEWQHIWSVWVAEVKTKARQIRDSIRLTGRGPTISELTEIEQKVMDIVGTASIEGFASLEVGISPHLAQSPPASEMLSSVQSPQESQEEQEPPKPRSGVSAVPCPIRRRIVPRRRITPRPSRPPAYENILRSLQVSSSSLKETIRHSADVIAAALRDNSAANLRAAEILASAMTSTHYSSHNNDSNE